MPLGATSVCFSLPLLLGLDNQPPQKTGEKERKKERESRGIASSLQNLPHKLSYQLKD
jgi:hypothetical protein